MIVQCNTAVQEGDANDDDDDGFGNFGDFQHEETIKYYTGSMIEDVCPYR